MLRRQLKPPSTPSYSHIVLDVAVLSEVALITLPGLTDNAEALVPASRRVGRVERLQTPTDDPDTLAAAPVPLRGAAFPLLLLFRVAHLAGQTRQLPPLSAGRGALSLLDEVLDRLGGHDIVEQRQQDGGRDTTDTGTNVEGGEAVRRTLRWRRWGERVGESGELRKKGEEEQTRRELVDVRDRLPLVGNARHPTHASAKATEHAVNSRVNVVPVLDALREVGSRRTASQGGTHVRTRALRGMLSHGQYSFTIEDGARAALPRRSNLHLPRRWTVTVSSYCFLELTIALQMFMDRVQSSRSHLHAMASGQLLTLNDLHNFQITCRAPLLSCHSHLKRTPLNDGLHPSLSHLPAALCVSA